MAEKISVKLTKEVRHKDGTTWPKNTRLDNTSRQELNARGIPDDAYEVIGGGKQETQESGKAGRLQQGEALNTEPAKTK